MVQRAGFEPAKHYALGPHPSPFDHSGTSALQLPKCLTYIRMAKQTVSISKYLNHTFVPEEPPLLSLHNSTLRLYLQHHKR